MGKIFSGFCAEIVDKGKDKFQVSATGLFHIKNAPESGHFLTKYIFK